ncbi:cilia- and flagella-associated protein 161-like [Amphiura filiformis]|uniref:cilia- and flagella-associated protein 161-like n=1 Tax=Amphiura filiformis TaxID=82378 RepID=UPI003B212595
MSVRTYNPSVRVGNWNEDLCLEEDMVKDFLEKRERGELEIQKASQLRESVLGKTELSVTSDGFVHFGDRVMVVNEADTCQVRTQPGVEPRQANALAINTSNSNVSASRMLEPSARSTFVIVPVDPAIREGTVLTYGKHFHLCTLPSMGGNLRLQSDIATFQSSAKKSRKQLVSFVDQTPSPYLTEWRILNFNPQIRFETEGLPVPANQKIIFNHCKSNQDLCVLSDCMVKTAFGKEYEVVAYTDLDSHKAEKDVNHWLIKTGHPGEPSTMATTLPVGASQ